MVKAGYRGSKHQETQTQNHVHVLYVEEVIGLDARGWGGNKRYITQ